MAHSSNINKGTMMKPQVEKVFNDLDQYLDFCRFELREFNPSHMYDKASDNYRAFLNSQRPPRQWQERGTNRGNPNYKGNKPRFENRSNEQRFSR
jgi:hypothetical protein